MAATESHEWCRKGRICSIATIAKQIDAATAKPTAFLFGLRCRTLFRQRFLDETLLLDCVRARIPFRRRRAIGPADVVDLQAVPHALDEPPAHVRTRTHVFR